MLSRKRKGKKLLPDWVGESYDASSNKNEEEEEERTKVTVVKAEDEFQSAGAISSQHRRQEKTPVPASAEAILAQSLPLLMFGGSLIYSFNRAECCALCEQLTLDLTSAGVVSQVGLDMEWPVDYRAGSSHKVALIQLCAGENKCYLFHIAPMGGLPTPLKNLLSHNQVVKYGVNIESDFWKLERDFDIQVRNIIRDSVVDLSKLANAKLKSTERWTLDGLTRNVLRHRLNKEDRVRCGRWDSFPLTEEQLQYAAVDAYASFMLVQKLKDR